MNEDSSWLQAPGAILAGAEFLPQMMWSCPHDIPVGYPCIPGVVSECSNLSS